MIPKRIIQFWCTGNRPAKSLPLAAKAAVASLKCLNPDFEYLFFDDEKVREFVQNEFPEYRSVFDSFGLDVQRYDFFRYLAIFRLGGFYFDLDVFLAQGLEKLLSHDCVFPFEELTLNRFLRSEYNMDWEVGNYAFGAAANHPFIGAIIENCVRAQRDA